MPVDNFETFGRNVVLIFIFFRSKLTVVLITSQEIG